MKHISRLIDEAERAVAALSRIMGVTAALAVAGIVVLLVSSSVRRYVLGSPVPFTEELTALLFAALSFLSIVEGFVHDRQIRVGILWRKLPHPLRNWTMIAGHVFTLVVLGWLARWTFEFALVSVELGSRTYVSGLLLWPWMMLIPVSLALLCLAVVVRTLVDLRATLRGEPVREEAVLSPGAPGTRPEL